VVTPEVGQLNMISCGNRGLSSRRSRTRPREAADLYRKGLANKVLVSRQGSLYQSAAGIGPLDYEPDQTAPLQLGVPGSAIEMFGEANADTKEEAVALREWTERNAALVFIIPTEIFTARRVQVDFSSRVLWQVRHH
jgi:hypothetical protein